MKAWIDDRRLFAAALTAVFLALAVFNVSHHAMWRDETRAWQIAAASPTLLDLYHNLCYEGVPMLWYLILWPLTKITSNMLAMQIVHAIIAAGVVFTFALAAPFGRVIKTLFAFGYFPFFEYATISRNYGLVFLFFLIGTAVVSLPNPRPLLLAAILAMLAQVSIWGAAFAGLLMLAGLIQWRGTSGRWIIAAAIVAVSCGLCYIDAKPGPAPWFIIGWDPQMPILNRAMASIGTLWKGWIPLPMWKRNWWYTNILDDFVVGQFLLACGLLTIAILCLRRSKTALIVLILGIVGQLVFTYCSFRGASRHHGQHFMVLIVACWLANRFGGVDGKRNLFLAILLSIHVVSGVGANIADALLPFSAGKATAEFIEHELPKDITIVGVEDYTTSGIAAYLHRAFYYPQMRAFATFYTQNDDARFTFTPQDTLEQIRNLATQSHRDVVLILSSARVIDADRNESEINLPASGDAPAMRFHVTLMKQLKNSTVPDEIFSVYRFTRVDL